MSKIYHTFIDNAVFLDIVMLMYNLPEYNDNNSMKSGSLWKYYGVEVNDTVNENNDDGNYVPLKFLLSINCKIELDFSWSRNCTISKELLKLQAIQTLIHLLQMLQQQQLVQHFK